MSNSDSLIAASAATPSCIYSSAVTMGPTASIQTTATPKSPPKATKVSGIPPVGQSHSDLLPSHLKRAASQGGSGIKNVCKSTGSFTEENGSTSNNMYNLLLVIQKLDAKEKCMPIQAWYYNPNSEEDPDEKDPTLPHHFKPDQQVPQEHLQTLGVLVWTALQTSNYKKNPFFEQVKNERGYYYEEVVTVAPGRLANYEQKKKDFFKEHLHEHEEIRLILEGGGYEDIRDFDGHWIRIHITQGVLIVLPKGMYHRFTVDHTNYLKAVLLYQETPSRIQFERNACTDIMEVREQYVTNVLSRGTSLQGNSSDLSNMLEGLDEELEILRKRQEIVEATLDESNLCADDAELAAQFKAEGNVILPAHPQLLRSLPTMAHHHAPPVPQVPGLDSMDVDA